MTLPQIASRLEFPKLLAELGLVGSAVEVGTYRGAFASEFLRDWPGVLHCVDPWIHQSDWSDMLNHDDFQMEQCYRNALDRLSPWIAEGRCIIHRETSAVAASKAVGPFDFVYIDARHDYTHARQDIRLWAPLVRAGGILAGHDYLDGRIGETVFGVKPAVDEWAHEFGYEVQTTSGQEGGFPSWYIQMAPNWQPESVTEGVTMSKAKNQDAAMERAFLRGTLPDSDRRAAEAEPVGPVEDVVVVPAVAPEVLQTADAGAVLAQDKARSALQPSP